MKTEQQHWKAGKGWQVVTNNELREKAQLVLAFGKRQVLEDKTVFESLKSMYPAAHILMSSTSGEIVDIEVHDGTVVATALYFEKTPIKVAQTTMQAGSNSEDAGKALASQLAATDLKHIFLISDGLAVNGSALVDGFYTVLPENISITGGLAGDGALFQSTLVGLDEAPKPNNVVAVGLYGENITIGFGSIGGWEAFGPERVVTKSVENVLYELDGKPALALYKTYLGEKAAELPASALLFPLSIKNESAVNQALVRTILTIDEKNQSMTFAGDIPQGCTVRLMKTNFDKLVSGAEEATEISQEILAMKAELAILVSCVGRKLVLGQRIEEEIEAVRAAIGDETTIAGFYSYGELAPYMKFKPCLLHNQTMTVTLLAEKQ
jgi:hypothetical protein